MVNSGILSEHFKPTPYWWDDVPPHEDFPKDLVERSDVVFMGSGITALSAALELAKHGRSVTILEAGSPGAGASRRNFGTLGRTLKRSFPQLARTHGADYAQRVYLELGTALRCISEVIEENSIQCDHNICGRFVAAAAPRHYDRMAEDLAVLKRRFDFDYHMVPRADQHSEIGSDYYWGGAVIPDLGALHPARYHQALLDRITRLGVNMVSNTPIVDIKPGSDGSAPIVVTTPRGTISAEHVVLATNGYTPRWLCWHARRVIPFNGYTLATEPVPAAVRDSILPKGRTLVDSNTDTFYMRLSPDGKRILFGGLTGSRQPDLAGQIRQVREIALRVFPQLESAKISHAWSGQCAATFDFMPHIGRRGNVWYSLGYNFAGLPMGTYLGRKLAFGLLGRPGARTIFAEHPFPTKPWYTGDPWFVPLAMRWFNASDRFERTLGQMFDRGTRQ